MNRKGNQFGFSLFEMVVALAVFAILSTAVGGVYVQAISGHQESKKHFDRLAQVQMAFLIIGRSVEQITPRRIRDNYGEFQPPLVVTTGLENSMEMTQTGRLPAGFPGNNLVRVAYGVQDEKLVKLQWQVLDRAQDTEPVKSVLLENVSGMAFRFLDAKATWHSSWPADELDDKQINSLPQAIEITVDSKDWGKIRRVFLLNDHG